MSSVKSTSAAAREYWRSLDQLQQTPEFTEFLHREFPVAASEFPQGVSRRRWLQLMGASFALTGMAGCRWEQETLAPFSARPANRIPGVPQTFATSWDLGGIARSLLVTAFDGRPIKIDGNPDHPECQGSSDAFSQALILHLYDPDRSTTARKLDGGSGIDQTWEEVFDVLGPAVEKLKAADGQGLRIVTEASSSPTRARLREEFGKQFPQARWIEHNAFSSENTILGAELAFGKRLLPQLNLEVADVILTVDGDLFSENASGLRMIREWSARRVPEAGAMNRLYSVESQFSAVGVAADHRLPLKSTDIPRFLESLEIELDDALGGKAVAKPGDNDSFGKKFLSAVTADLVAHKGKSIVVVGETQSPEVHARAWRINSKLENLGETVTFHPAPAVVDGDLAQLVSDLDAGSVELLVVLGGNPVYTASSGEALGKAITKAKLSVRLGDYVDETSRVCKWHVPKAHPLETWGDGRSADGLLTLQQPLIAPLFNGKSEIELLAWLLGDQDADGLTLVRTTVKEILPAGTFEKDWRTLVHDGFRDESSSQPVPKLREGLEIPPAPAGSKGLEVVLTPSSSTYDGRFANNGWLQETPKSLSKLTWDNAALIAPKTAEELGVKIGSLIRIEAGGRSIELPVYVLPGQAPGSIGVELGYGRTAAGHVGGLVAEDVPGVGVNAYALRAGNEIVLTDVKVTKTGGTYPLSTTQDHHAIDKIGLEEISGRIGELVREGTLKEYESHPDFAKHKVHHPPLESLWQETSSEGRAWGMSIDLSRCIGCNACMVACQSENNVPIVGKEQIARGREMHWIRMDRYFHGDFENPEVVTQPVTCHHCENAPCEQVCPVAATVHSPEGLNDMAYNRCVGTRYCANNCPYKVRRFNFFDYNKKYEAANTELMRMLMNPEVTVRERGVMEKCTYCVQRIQNVKVVAKRENRPVRDGEVVTACQQACPAQAIAFGDLNDPESQVARLHANPRSYAMLEELNVKPRTQYLARIRNPHEWLAPEDHGHGHGAHADKAHGVAAGHGEEENRKTGKPAAEAH